MIDFWLLPGKTIAFLSYRNFGQYIFCIVGVKILEIFRENAKTAYLVSTRTTLRRKLDIQNDAKVSGRGGVVVCMRLFVLADAVPSLGYVVFINFQFLNFTILPKMLQFIKLLVPIIRQ